MAHAWRRHIVHELHARDRTQSACFTQLFTHYAGLLERTNGIAVSLRGQSSTHLDPVQLACQVVQLQTSLSQTEQRLQQQSHSVAVAQSDLQMAVLSHRSLVSRVNSIRDSNSTLKRDYDSLLRQQAEAELSLRQEVQQRSCLLEQLSQSDGQRRKDSQSGNHSNTVTTGSSPLSLAPATTARIRSASASSPRLSAFRNLFTRRGRSHSLEVELRRPTQYCVSTGMPCHVLHVWDQVHCCRFSPCSEILATAADDRHLRLWEVHHDRLSLGASLFGFTESVTCIDFDKTGFLVLASSHDKSALLWQLNEPAPKLTLTGHRRTVSAARFSAPPLVVTGSADATIRLWDLQREYCSHVLEAESHVSDLVCSESSVFSSHLDGRVRLWDLRCGSRVLDLRLPDRVSGLDLSSDGCWLLCCCRDNALHLFDLRGQSFTHTCLKGEGLHCSDRSKATISPDRCYAAGASADGAVYIWDISSGRVQSRVTDQTSSSLVGVSWSVSGRYLVTVDKRRRAVLWSE